MQKGFCCTHLAFRLALQTSQANWVSVSETFPQQKDFRNCQGGEERRATCSHHGGSTQAAAINFHLGPRGHGDGKTTAQHVPPQRSIPRGRQDHSPARSSTEKRSDDEPVRSSGLTGCTQRAHVGWQTPHTLWSCGVPLALRQTEAGLRGPRGRSQGEGAAGPCRGKTNRQAHPPAAGRNRVGSAPSCSQSR